MSNELFVELSDEQQEVVAGGASLDQFSTGTNYSFDNIVFGGGSTSGMGGSTTVGAGSVTAVDTSGFTTILGLSS
jgi:hypothetical protein